MSRLCTNLLERFTLRKNDEAGGRHHNERIGSLIKKSSPTVILQVGEDIAELAMDRLLNGNFFTGPGPHFFVYVQSATLYQAGHQERGAHGASTPEPFLTHQKLPDEFWI